MSQRLGMADGRCFTIGTAATLFNDYVMKQNNIAPQDNYSYRRLLQMKGPAILDDITARERCDSCDVPFLKVKNTY